MKNRYWAAGLCLLVLMLCLTSACGGGGSSTTSTSSTAVTSTTPTKTTTPPATTTTAAGNSVSDILGKGMKFDSIRYDLTMTASGQTTKITIYQKGNKTREEMTVGSVVAAILIDADAQTSYTYMPSLNMATKMTYDSSAIIPGAWETPNTIMNYNPNIVGTESIDGKSCTVIAWDIPGSGSAKEWVWTEKSFPLKMETTYSGVTTTIEYSNIDFSDIPDSIFQLPEGVQIVDAGG
jgi:hypothetical protein